MTTHEWLAYLIKRKTGFIARTRVLELDGRAGIDACEHLVDLGLMVRTTNRNAHTWKDSAGFGPLETMSQMQKIYHASKATR